MYIFKNQTLQPKHFNAFQFIIYFISFLHPFFIFCNFLISIYLVFFYSHCFLWSSLSELLHMCSRCCWLRVMDFHRYRRKFVFEMFFFNLHIFILSISYFFSLFLVLPLSSSSTRSWYLPYNLQLLRSSLD